MKWNAANSVVCPSFELEEISRFSLAWISSRTSAGQNWAGEPGWVAESGKNGIVELTELAGSSREISLSSIYFAYSSVIPSPLVSWIFRSKFYEKWSRYGPNVIERLSFSIVQMLPIKLLYAILPHTGRPCQLHFPRNIIIKLSAKNFELNYLSKSEVSGIPQPQLYGLMIGTKNLL